MNILSSNNKKEFFNKDNKEFSLIRNSHALEAIAEESFMYKAGLMRTFVLNGLDPSLNMYDFHEDAERIINKYINQIEIFYREGISKISSIKPKITNILNYKIGVLEKFSNEFAFKIDDFEYTLDNDVPAVDIKSRLYMQFSQIQQGNGDLKDILDKYIAQIESEKYNSTVRAEILHKGYLVSERDYTSELHACFRNDSSDKSEILVNKVKIESALERIKEVNNTCNELTKLKNCIIDQLQCMLKVLKQGFILKYDGVGEINLPEVGLHIDLRNKDGLYQDNLNDIKMLCKAKCRETEYTAKAYAVAMSYRIHAIIEEHIGLVNICDRAHALIRAKEDK